jgi:hypothetical protein
VETQVGDPADAGPLTQQHVFTLVLPGDGVDVQLAGQGGLERHGAPPVGPVETREATRWQALR